MIEVYNEGEEKPYILNIIMSKAETDVDNLIKEGPIQTLKEFFPIFRDCILGIV